MIASARFDFLWMEVESIRVITLIVVKVGIYFYKTLSILSYKVTFEGSMVLVFGIECARGRF